MILAGDAGATKTELSLYEHVQGKLKPIASEKFSSCDFKNPGEMIRKFLKERSEVIDSACIGIPGPVVNGKVRPTNLPWELDEKNLSVKLNIPLFKLANDLECLATAVNVISENDLIKISPESIYADNLQNKVILAPGTGLGQAGLIYTESGYKIVANEGGHADFAPTDETETELLIYLREKFGHVSYERIASGSGILNIYEFLKSEKKYAVSGELAGRLKSEDPAAVISDEGISGRSLICEKTMDIFVSVLGAQAGNMVLNYKATGGVYLGGGIPIKIIKKLKEGGFIKSFLNKGRLRYLPEASPVYVIKNESAGTFGAAVIASEL